MPHAFIFFLTIILLLTACEPVPIDRPDTSASTSAPIFTPFPLTSTALPTDTPSTTPTPTPLPLSSLEGLRMAYIVDGNLYLQDSGEQPVQLTDSGKDHAPIFSDDGEKIVFFRGELPYEVYSINTDGSQEQALVTGSRLIALGLGYDAFTELRTLDFVPGTHQLLFNTHQLSPLYIETRNLEYEYKLSNQDLLLVDTDTSEIKKLLKPGQSVAFRVSPDGKLVGIQAADHIDVIGLDGKTIRHNLTTYPSTWLYIWEPDIYWTQDSDKLNIVFPILDGNALTKSGPDPRTFWQYPLNFSFR
ncbi:MAG: TolB family protein [Chloroflexota bacterium]